MQRRCRPYILKCSFIIIYSLVNTCNNFLYFESLLQGHLFIFIILESGCAPEPVWTSRWGESFLVVLWARPVNFRPWPGASPSYLVSSTAHKSMDIVIGQWKEYFVIAQQVAAAIRGRILCDIIDWTPVREWRNSLEKRTWVAQKLR